MTTHARSIAVTTHGRYLLACTTGEPCGVLVGCHGYGEGADVHMQRLLSVPGSEAWACVSVQGLHRFYNRRSEEVVASWMTRQDRELMIADNVAYVSAVVGAVVRETGARAQAVYAGFSQGVATAFRAACASPDPAGMIALGGDIPPEIDSRSLAWLRGALVGRGARDEWYSAAKLDQDVARLEEAGTPLVRMTLDAGHEWTEEFSRAAGAFLARFR